MTILIPLAALTVWSTMATIVLIARDGYRAIPTRPMY